MSRFLHVRPGAHFFGGAQEDADAAGISPRQRVSFLAVGLGVMDVGDFLGRYSLAISLSRISS